MTRYSYIFVGMFVAAVLAGAYLSVANAQGTGTISAIGLLPTTTPTYGFTLPFQNGSSTPLDIRYSQATTSALAITGLASCNTIDTTADGDLICGTDEGSTFSASTGITYENRDWQVSTLGGGLYVQPTSTITVFANNGFISNASSTVRGDFTIEQTISAQGIRVARNTDPNQYITINEGDFGTHRLQGFGSKPLIITNEDSTANGISFQLRGNGATSASNGTTFLTITNNSFTGFGTTSPYSTLTIWHDDLVAGHIPFNIVNHASTTLFQVDDGGIASTTGLIISGQGTGSIQCAQIGVEGTVTGTGSACGAGGGSAENEWQTVTLGGTLYLQPTTTIATFHRSGLISNASSTAMDTWNFDSSGAPSGASTLTVNYLTEATSTILGNFYNAWSIASSTTDTPIFSINTTRADDGDKVATSTFYGGFSVNNGNFFDDTFSSYAGNLGLGNIKLADNCGVCQLVDQHITVNGGAASTTQSMTASFLQGGVPWITGFGVQNSGVEFESGVQVGIASSTPFGFFSIEVSSSSPNYSGAVPQPIFYIGDQSSTTMPTSGWFRIENGGEATFGGGINATTTAANVATIADSSCGTSPSVQGSNVEGMLTTGSVAPTECSVMFAVPWDSTPVCTDSQNSGTAAAFNLTSSSTGVTFSATALAASSNYSYHCFGQGGYKP